MDTVSHALDNPALYSPAFEPADASFHTLANAFGLASGCGPSWTNGCAGHHYHSWNDPTLQTHAFRPSTAGRTAVRETLVRGERSPWRLACAFAVRFLGRCDAA